MTDEKEPTIEDADVEPEEDAEAEVPDVKEDEVPG